MDRDDETVGQILTRREAFSLIARTGMILAGGGALQQIAQAALHQDKRPKVHLVASPELTEGPFFVDEKLNRSDLRAGSSRVTVANGLPLGLSFKVYKMVGTSVVPLKGAHVDVWHADAAGVYSDESNPMNHENTAKQTWLRGYQVTDDQGLVHFKTIFPGWYPGRAPHIHFKVRNFASAQKITAEFTSQVFFYEHDADRIYSKEPYASRVSRETTNQTDNIFTERQVDGSMAGSHMLLDLKPSATGSGYNSQFSIILTDATMKPGRRHDRGPGGPPPDGPPPGPPPDWGS